MLKLYPAAAVVGLGLLCAGCAGGQNSPSEPGSAPSSAQTMTYKCESCGKTVTVAADAPAPSC
jgi:hypothetical protein